MNPKISHLKYPLIIASCLSMLLCSLAFNAQDLEEPLINISRKNINSDTADIYFESESLDKDHLYVQQDNHTIITTQMELKAESLKSLVHHFTLTAKRRNSTDPLTRARAKREYMIIRQLLKHFNEEDITTPPIREEEITAIQSNSLDIFIESDESLSIPIASEVATASEEKSAAKLATQILATDIAEKDVVDAIRELPKDKVEKQPAVEKPAAVKEKIERTASIGKSFISQKGSLPWPVNGRKIVSTYGIRPNAQSLGLPSENFGVDLYVKPGSNVHAVHDGKVLFVTVQPPYETIMAIDHGDYTSVYYFLEQTNLSRGTAVKAGQTIGKVIARDQSPNFHFEIWRGQEQINPLPWLSK